jgi:hypothetical protein
LPETLAVMHGKPVRNNGSQVFGRTVAFVFQSVVLWEFFLQGIHVIIAIRFGGYAGYCNVFVLS